MPNRCSVRVLGQPRGGWAFDGCEALAKIDVASGNKNYSSVDGVLFSKDKKTLVCYPPGKAAKSYEIPRGVTSIGKNAFSICLSLTQVTFADTSGWYFDKGFTQPAGAGDLASSLKAGRALYKKTR